MVIILSVDGLFLPERYLLMMEGGILVLLAKSAALSLLSNIILLKFSEKIDTAFYYDLFVTFVLYYDLSVTFRFRKIIPFGGK